MKSSHDYSVTFPCLNCIDYTKGLINSMIENGDNLSNVVAIDNGSTDDTFNLLSSFPDLTVIQNKKNYGVGVALNQGAMAKQSEWTIFMDNDIIVSKNWIENLINSAIKNDLKVISPALVEGEYDYDINSFFSSLSDDVKSYIRDGDNHAVCIAVHESVWDEVGFFRPFPSLFGYEDTLFFHALKKKNIRTAISGASWLHHFGSATQKAMKKDMGLKPKDDIAVTNHHKLLCQNWFARKYSKFQKKNFRKNSQILEIEKFNMTLRGDRKHGEFIWLGEY